MQLKYENLILYDNYANAIYSSQSIFIHNRGRGFQEEVEDAYMEDTSLVLHVSSTLQIIQEVYVSTILILDISSHYPSPKKSTTTYLNTSQASTQPYFAGLKPYAPNKLAHRSQDIVNCKRAINVLTLKVERFFFPPCGI